MSINWVMLNAEDFIRLPGEKPIYKSPNRTALSLTTPKSYPANSGFVALSSDSGILYLTNQRVVYVPNKQTEEFKSFSAPLLNLHDTHLTVPWFGPNAWEAIVQPVHGGGLPATSTGIELKLTFKEGGAPDFHSSFERIKERFQQALESARDGSDGQPRNAQYPNGVNMQTVHLDQLPSYEASGQDRIAPLAAVPQSDTVGSAPQAVASNANAGRGQPAEAPPGYEEAQQQSVQQELDRRLSET